ncbi:hypothetical protein B0H19DRAFT_1228143 [Mycena capillaripes]|nr:hypothetical protein B0H19DRAFT_1228143 [Mycena capillaripes]
MPKAPSRLVCAAVLSPWYLSAASKYFVASLNHVYQVCSGSQSSGQDNDSVFPPISKVLGGVQAGAETVQREASYSQFLPQARLLQLFSYWHQYRSRLHTEPASDPYQSTCNRLTLALTVAEIGRK